MRHGFLLIDKPEGPTSHDVVDTVRARLSERKIGHLGTLDPAAGGLLVLAVGAKALKVVELFGHLLKEYVAEVTFGAVSSTYDREGVIEEVLRKPGVPDPDLLAVRRTIEDQFLGKVMQVPPAASAVQVGGERAYRKMRQGRAVSLPARAVVIDACDILSYTYPRLELRIVCGSGTYIRSLAHDLGKSLRVGGYLSKLRRTRVGDWSVECALLPERVSWGDVIPLKEILAKRCKLELDAAQAEDIRNGRDIAAVVEPNTIGWHDGLPIAILEPRGEKVHARKVL